MGVITISAGNDGSALCGDPGENPAVLCVGASDSADRTTFFSNYGVRLDHQREWVPAGSNPAGLFVPARSWLAVENVPNYWDVSPRASLAYDVFGTHKTAVKTSINRYVVNSLGGISAANDPAMLRGTNNTAK